MSTLKEFLDNYKNVTIDLINNLYCDNLSNIDEFMKMRQSILECIGNLNCSKEDFNLITNEIQLPAIEERLKEVMTEKKGKLRAEIEKISTVKNANNSYNKNLYGKSMVFSKKI